MGVHLIIRYCTSPVYVSAFTANASGASGSGEEGGRGETTALKSWKVGDKCLAQWSDDSQW